VGEEALTGDPLIGEPFTGEFAPAANTGLVGEEGEALLPSMGDQACDTFRELGAMRAGEGLREAAAADRARLCEMRNEMG
jgi:hypothetical protein